MFSADNKTGTIQPASEIHYHFYQKIETHWPQSHDYYELTLVTSGCMTLESEQERWLLTAGTLILLRPGDVHTGVEKDSCEYVSILFSARVIADMFRYLNDDTTYSRIVQAMKPLVTQLGKNEREVLQDRLEKLHLLPVDDMKIVHMELLRLTLNIVLEYVVPILSSMRMEEVPAWLRELLCRLEQPEYFAGDLDMLAALSGRSREYICRSFRKYLGYTPTEYLNYKRLNYAANLLLHTDKKINDIAYASGFQSLSRFYHSFQEKFQCAPTKYRSLGQREE